jgi:hypothetical protein
MWLLDVNLPNGLARLLHGTSAGPALAALPELAIVVVTLPQVREEAYLAEFETRWRRKPIEPLAGAVVEWP